MRYAFSGLTSRVAGASLVSLLALFAVSTDLQAATMSDAEALTVSYAAIELNPSNPDDMPAAPGAHPSPLSYVGGLVLSSSDPRFGGLSGLEVSDDGTRLIAVTDTGHWVTASLFYRDGALAGLSDATIAPLRDPSKQSVAGSKRLGDAEALTRLPDGRLAVAFERIHRVWAYEFDTLGDAAPAMPVAISPDLANAENNKGLEALAALPDGTLLAVTEATLTPQGDITGWRVGQKGAGDVSIKRIHPFDLTDMAVLPSGDLLTLERRYSPLGGVGAQMRIVAAQSIDGDAPLDGPIIYRSTAGQTVDNMEGIAVRQDEAGRIFVYVVSDDNFNPLQRTLLLMFELKDL